MLLVLLMLTGCSGDCAEAYEAGRTMPNICDGVDSVPFEHRDREDCFWEGYEEGYEEHYCADI
ncbi:MAG: hypothetical protein JRI25_08445 [Deltaproteobacteria bacterium]|nr:hypothetical protein [Deltaproteobacteria bacterium]MBW2254611.1 hypothetical protein [Deltaproteobacteria bacterium]